MTFKTLLSLMSMWLLSSLYQSVQAQTDETIRKKHFNIEKQLAIGGYDPVAYFTAKKAIKGSKENTFTYGGITYYFSSKETLNAFKKEPSRYEPAYGGWCAYAMGESGEKVEIDPQTFKVKDGRLYLFYNAFFNIPYQSGTKTKLTCIAKLRNTGQPL